MAITDEEWNQLERELINRFFRVKVPEHLGSKAASQCTEETCIAFAKAVLKTDDVYPDDNQGAMSFTLRTPDTIIQFRLTPLRETDILALANQIYGDLVPKPTFRAGFPLPVYTSKVIPGRVHIFQSFPKEAFPLERQIARSAFFPQLQPLAESSWTKTAPETLRRLAQNNSLRTHAPELLDIVSRRLQPQLHLLGTLPRVLTHHVLSEVNILVNDAGNVTGVIDFESAQVEAFGMCIWSLYECFFGSMDNAKWAFFDERPILEEAFWESLWANMPKTLKRDEAETAIKVSLSIGVINRYFDQGRIMDRIDLSDINDRRSLEYARGVLPQVWE